MDIYKAAQHVGRRGSAKHNDREMASEYQDHHIDITKEDQNLYVSYKGLPFTEAEKAFYNDHYGEWVKQRNERYIKDGHKDRAKSVESMLHDKRTMPEEVILQIGNKNKSVDPKIFEACVNDYLKALGQYNSNCHVIDVAIHNDEATPHCHIRRCFDYVDEHGNRRLSQRKALEALGIDPPDKNLPDNLRCNNRKMTFDAMMREKWYDICEAHGLMIDREPRSVQESRDSRPYKIRRQEQQIEANKVILQQQQNTIDEQQIQIDKLNEQVRRYELAMESTYGLVETLKFMQDNDIPDLIDGEERAQSQTIEEETH